MIPARAIMYAVAAVLLVAGVWLFSRLRLASTTEAQGYACRIAGTMALAGGLCLTTFATLGFA